MVRAATAFFLLAALGGILPGQLAYPPTQPPGTSAVNPANQPATQGAAQGDIDDPADLQHGVARVSLLGGEVNIRRGDTNEFVAAAVNAPLVSHDRVQTSPGGAAEVQLDGANVIRIPENTDLGFADLKYRRAQVQLGAGKAIVRVLRPSETQVELDTPSVAVRALGTADLRITVFDDGTTQVSVRAGSAEIDGPRGSERLDAPRSVLVRGSADAPEFQDVAPPARDPFDDWSASLDAQMSSPSYEYTGGDMAGVGELDANGSWVGSQYGQVWSPNAAASGWAPYTQGQWVYEPYYGWTWVDAAPWGWAPSHYGRWFSNGARGWCWWPGAGRRTWGPAYVGFFGLGGGGSLGWVALAPYEGFHSWWGRGNWRGGYGSGFYRNAGFRGGAVTASFASFGGPRGRFSPVSRDVLARATPLQGRLPVGPGTSGFRFNDRPAFANPRLAAAPGRTFFQQSRFQQSRVGRSVPVYRQAAPAVSAGGGIGWQRFGDPRPPSGSYRQGFAGGNRESGWHQFGQPSRAPSTGQFEQRRPQPSSQYRQAPEPKQQRGFGGLAGTNGTNSPRSSSHAVPGGGNRSGRQR